MIGIAFYYITFISLMCQHSYIIGIGNETFIKETAEKSRIRWLNTESSNCIVVDSWVEYRVVRYPGDGVVKWEVQK